MVIPQVDYWMSQNVNCYWTQVQASPSCQNHSICNKKSLHSLPKFASKMQRIQVGNGQYVSVLFIIPVIIDVHGHRFQSLHTGI